MDVKGVRISFPGYNFTLGSINATASRPGVAWMDMQRTHPHRIRSLEWYGDSFIAYSLGNFVFDQMWADHTRRGIILRCRLVGCELVEVEVFPYLIRDYCRPVVLDQAGGKRIIGELLSFSDL